MKTPKITYEPIIQPSPVILVLRFFVIFSVIAWASFMLKEESFEAKLMGILMLLMIPILLTWTVVLKSSVGLLVRRHLLLPKKHIAWGDIVSVSLDDSSLDDPIKWTIWLYNGSTIKQNLNVPNELIQDLYDTLIQNNVLVETNIEFLK